MVAGLLRALGSMSPKEKPAKRKSPAQQHRAFPLLYERFGSVQSFWRRNLVNGSRHDWCGDRIFRQRVFEYFVEVAHVGDLDVAEDIRGQIRYGVGFVVRGQEHFANARALGAENFLLHATNRQHDAGQGHLAGHRQAVAHGPIGQQADQRGDHRRSRARSILRHASRGHVNVDVVLAEKVRLDAVTLSVGAHPGEGRGHGFLHDFAEMPGHSELLATAHAGGFDEDDVAAHGRPHEAYGYAGALDALLDFLLGAELRHAQVFADDFRSHGHFFHVAFGDAARLLARDGGDLALQVAYPGFAGEAVNDLAQGVIREFQLLEIFDAVLGSLLGDEVLVRDVQLFFAGVARQFDHFHAVAQRLGYWVHPVGRGDEEHLRQIEGHVQIVVTERVVLLGVQNFHQRGRRIAAEVASQFVDFIQHADGIVALGALQALNDLAGQRTDIGAAMTADFRFIVHAAEGDAHEFAA